MPSPEPLWHAATRGCDGADSRSPKSCPASTSCHEGNEVDCDRVIDDFVARVNSHPRVPLEPDEVPVALRVACEAHTDKKGYGSTHWKIVAANNVARVEALERRLGQPFPPSFRSLICRYSFPAFECGPMLFFSNTGESLEWELQDRLFADTVMAPQLLAAGYLQIGYDPGVYTEPPEYRPRDVVVFLGQNYTQGWPHLPEREPEIRRAVVEGLHEALGERYFACYGQNWPAWGHEPLSAALSAERMRRAFAVVSVSLTSQYERYSSDRLFRALACGPVVLVKRFADCEALGLRHGERLYRFATYTGARVERLDIASEALTWVARDRHHRLEMRAIRAGGGLLRAPTMTGMGRRIAETLNASVETALYSLKGGRPRRLFHGTGRHAGLEAVGNLLRLQAMWASEL